MGSWNYRVFDDDTAYDVLEDLKASSDIITDMKEYFEDVMNTEYVGYDEGNYALVSAAVIDSIINNTNHECDEEDYSEWINSLKQYDFAPLKQMAANAIDAVLSDNSELKELWEENPEPYSSWREDKLSIRDRLL